MPSPPPLTPVGSPPTIPPGNATGFCSSAGWQDSGTSAKAFRGKRLPDVCGLAGSYFRTSNEQPTNINHFTKQYKPLIPMSKPTIPLTPGKYYHIYNRGINSCPIFYDDFDHNHFLFLYGKYISQVADTFAWVLMRTHFHLLVRIKENMVYRYSMEEIRKMEAAQNAGRQSANTNRSLSHNPNSDAIGFSGNATGLLRPEDNLTFAKWETVCTQDAGKQDSGSPAGKYCGRRLPDVCGSDAQERFPNISGISKGMKIPNPSAHLGHLFNAYARYFNQKYNRHGSLFENQFKRKPIDKEKYLRNVVVYIHKNAEHHGYCPYFKQYPWCSYHSFAKNDGSLICKEEVMEWFGSFDNFILAHHKDKELEKMEA